jgi:hypothetical protein
MIKINLRIYVTIIIIQTDLFSFAMPSRSYNLYATSARVLREQLTRNALTIQKVGKC